MHQNKNLQQIRFKATLLIKLVRVGGFEPPVSCFQAGRDGQAPLHPDELARTGGLEPPPPGFVIRHIVQFCYVRRLERPTGFEPAFPSLRGWCPALDDDRDLAPAAGFEPASFSVNSRARSPRVLDRN